MKNALLTGSGGQVGSYLHQILEQSGWGVRQFDLSCGQNLLDESSVFDAVAGCDAVIHCGAIAHDRSGTPAEIMATNLLGTWHVLMASEAHGVSRVIYFSSAQVFGFAEGEGVPEYLPVDDHHPLRATRPYGLSKRLAEDMCAAWTERTGIPTIVLRPVMVLTETTLRSVRKEDVELGAFVHVDDVADAVIRALAAEVRGHVRLTLCGPGDFDTSAAMDTLGWSARMDWPQ